MSSIGRSFGHQQPTTHRVCSPSHRQPFWFSHSVNWNEWIGFTESFSRFSRYVSFDSSFVIAVWRNKQSSWDFLLLNCSTWRQCDVWILTGSTVEWSQLKEKLLVVTCGASAAICATRSQTWQYPAVKLSAEQVKDTTGAGDAFLAGFLSQLLDNQPLEVCVARGHQTAALVVTQTGCRLPVWSLHRHDSSLSVL